jgi:glutathione S-transferase
MTEKITLYYKDANYEALSCLIALEAAGYEVDFVKVDQKSLFGKDLKTINPSSLTPFAHCNNVTYI